MRLSTVMALSVTAALAVGCSSMKPAQRPTPGRPGVAVPVSTDEVGGLVESGIEAYNNGDIGTAKANLDAVLQATRDKPMKSTRARAHFYLAALAWDVGDIKKTDRHLRQCRRLQPLFAPDWTFIAPGLRKHYENLRVKVSPPPEPVPEKPAPEKPAPEKPAPKPEPGKTEPKPVEPKPEAQPAKEKSASGTESKTESQKLTNPGPARS